MRSRQHEDRPSSMLTAQVYVWFRAKINARKSAPELMPSKLVAFIFSRHRPIQVGLETGRLAATSDNAVGGKAVEQSRQQRCLVQRHNQARQAQASATEHAASFASTRTYSGGPAETGSGSEPRLPEAGRAVHEPRENKQRSFRHRHTIARHPPPFSCADKQKRPFLAAGMRETWTVDCPFW